MICEWWLALYQKDGLNEMLRAMCFSLALVCPVVANRNHGATKPPCAHPLALQAMPLVPSQPRWSGGRKTRAKLPIWNPLLHRRRAAMLVQVSARHSVRYPRQSPTHQAIGHPEQVYAHSQEHPHPCHRHSHAKGPQLPDEDLVPANREKRVEIRLIPP